MKCKRIFLGAQQELTECIDVVVDCNTQTTTKNP